MRYVIHVDRRQYEELCGLFSDDCIWTRPEMAPMVGPAQALAFLREVETERAKANPHGMLQRHLVTSALIDVQDENTAEGTWYGIVFEDDKWNGQLPAPMPSTPYLVVEYQTSFRRDIDGWRITRHNATHVFRGTR
jgi:hypothetical protein